MLFDEIQVGTNGQMELLLKGIQNLVSKTGQPYQAYTCADTSGNIKKINNFNKLIDENLVKLPLVLSANVRADLYLNNKTFLMNEFKKGTLTPDDFKPKTQVDAKKVWNDMMKVLKTISDASLGKFVCTVLDKNKEKFKVMPLNTTAFNRVNGLMEATFKLMNMADEICKLITYLDRDLMIAAASLFYIGQVNATNSEFEYTELDVLLGPGILSLQEILEVEATYKDPIDTEKLTLMKHLIVSRNRGHYAAIPESITLLYLDSILQETEEVHNILSTLGDNGYVDRYNPHRSRIYKVPANKENTEKKDE